MSLGVRGRERSVWVAVEEGEPVWVHGATLEVFLLAGVRRQAEEDMGHLGSLMECVWGH